MTLGLDKAQAQPSKRFFVGMLVRDIELTDALLDLLDNCVDGILRNTDHPLDDPRPYAGYWANFVIGPDYFELDDNCGGIPIKLAREKAFAVGRPEPIAGEDAQRTVGMYGIGMKRAIFKLGEDATVRSWSDEPFEVKIDKNWLTDNDSWKPLPLKVLSPDAFEYRGTKISVRDLNAPIVREFGGPNFVGELSRRISSIYALIIAKGFSVSIRRNVDEEIPAPIAGRQFGLLAAPNFDPTVTAIAPMVFTGRVCDVDVEIYAGLYRRLLDPEEEAGEENAKNRSDDSGWTVACNDRVVIDRDQSWVTGWGESAVPKWHNQFNAICGLVLLTSDHPDHLPLTTTKVGVDHGTAIYSAVKDMMRDATRKFTDFTNKWKRFEGDLTVLYERETVLTPLDTLRSRRAELPTRPWKDTEVQVFTPKLPLPPKDITNARVSFVAPSKDVRKLALVYFDDVAAKPKEVGQEAFTRELRHYDEAAE